MTAASDVFDGIIPPLLQPPLSDHDASVGINAAAAISSAIQAFEARLTIRNFSLGNEKGARLCVIFGIILWSPTCVAMPFISGICARDPEKLH
jgi:hypothetical protein